MLPFACIIYVTIGFRTFITSDQLLILGTIFYAICLLILIVLKKFPIVKALFTGVSFAFAALNLLLLLNYFISYGSYEETYEYKSTTFRYLNKRGKTRSGQGSLIRLLNDKGFDVYDEYTSIRFFWIYDDIPNDYFNTITYTTKDGLFNYKIYTNRVFNEKPELNF